MEVNEERYQHMVESSPDIILIVKDSMIQYINPRGAEICSLDAGDDYSPLFEQAFLELVSSSIDKVTKGAIIQLSKVIMNGKEEKKHLTDVWMGEIVWDGNPAVELIVRIKGE